MDSADETVAWLLEGDVSVEYATRRDVPPDPRLAGAVEVLVSLRRPDGTWPAGRTWPGQTHVPMNRALRSRFVTLQALRVLRTYG